MTVTNINDKRQFVEYLRAEKKSTDSEDLRRALHMLSVGLYSEDVHFVMELLQNAEDNQYPEGLEPRLRFDLRDGLLTVSNNERGFSDDDVRSICSVGDSTKTNRTLGYVGEKRIGEKGIGFKSVFKVTDRPEIHSVGYHFCFDQANKIIPEWVESSSNAEWNTQILLPLKPDCIDRVERELLDISPSVLLFLTHLRCIEISVNGQERRLSVDPRGSLRILTDGTSVEHWYLYLKELVVPDDVRLKEETRRQVERRAIGIAFAANAGGDVRDRIQSIYAFLPTTVKPGFRFRIQADFMLKTDRSDLVRDSGWNHWLLSQVPVAYAESVENLCLEFPEFLRTHLQAAPLGQGINDSDFQPVAEECVRRLQNIACVPDDRGSPCVPTEVVEADDKTRRLFPANELLTIFASAPRAIHRYTDTSLNVADPVAKAIGLRRFSKDDLLTALDNTPWVDGQDEDWFALLYSTLATGWEIITASDLKGKAILLLQADSIKLGQIGLGTICFTETQQRQRDDYGLSVLGLDFLRHDLTWEPKNEEDGPRERNRQIRSWLSRMGVTSLGDPATVVSGAFLTAIRNGVMQRLTEEQLIGPTLYLKEKWEEIAAGLSVDDRRLLADGYPLITTDVMAQTRERTMASKAYILAPYTATKELREVLKRVPGARMVTDAYFQRQWEKQAIKTNREEKLRQWAVFLQELGCHDEIRILRTDWWPPDAESRSWYSSGVRTKSQRLDPDFVSPDLDVIVHSVIASPQDQSQAELLIKYLDDHWERISKRCEEPWPNATWIEGARLSRLVPSSLISFLRSHAWCPGSDGMLHRPEELLLDTPQNRRDAPVDVFVTIKLNDYRLVEALGIRQDVGADGIIANLRQLRDEDSVRDLANQILHLMQRLAQLANEGQLTVNLREAFSTEPLLYCPCLTGDWHQASAMVWEAPLTTNISVVPVAQHIYLELRDFLVDRLGIRERLEPGDVVEVWIKTPADQTDIEGAKARLAWVYEALESMQRTGREITPDTLEELREGLYYMTVTGTWCRATEVILPDDDVITNAFAESDLPLLWIPRNVPPESSAGLLRFLSDLVRTKVSQAEVVIHDYGTVQSFGDREKLEAARNVLAILVHRKDEISGIHASPEVRDFFTSPIVGSDKFEITFSLGGKKGSWADFTAFYGAGRLWVRVDDGSIAAPMNVLAEELLRCIGLNSNNSLCDRLVTYLLSHDLPEERSSFLARCGIDSLVQTTYDRNIVLSDGNGHQTTEIGCEEKPGDEDGRTVPLLDRPVERYRVVGSNAALRREFPTDSGVDEFISEAKRDAGLPSDDLEVDPDRQSYTFTLRKYHLDNGYIPFHGEMCRFIADGIAMIECDTGEAVLLSLRSLTSDALILAANCDGSSSVQQLQELLLAWPPGVIVGVTATAMPGTLHISAVETETVIDEPTGWDIDETGKPKPWHLGVITLPYLVDIQAYREDFARSDHEAVSSIMHDLRAEGRGAVLDTVLAVMVDLMNKASLPVGFNVLYREVLARRPCAAQSVRANLTAYACFVRQADDTWDYDQSKGLELRSGVRRFLEISEAMENLGRGESTLADVRDSRPESSETDHAQRSKSTPEMDRITKRIASVAFEFSDRLLVMPESEWSPRVDRLEEAVKEVLNDCTGTEVKEGDSVASFIQDGEAVQRAIATADLVERGNATSEELIGLLVPLFREALAAGSDPFMDPSIDRVIRNISVRYRSKTVSKTLMQIADDFVEKGNTAIALRALGCIGAKVELFQERQVKASEKRRNALLKFEMARRGSGDVITLLSEPAEYWAIAREALDAAHSEERHKQKDSFLRAMSRRDWQQAAMSFLEMVVEKETPADAKKIARGLMESSVKAWDDKRWSEAYDPLALAAMCLRRGCDQWPPNDDDAFDVLDMLGDCCLGLGSVVESLMLRLQIWEAALTYKAFSRMEDILPKVLESAETLRIRPIIERHYATKKLHETSSTVDREITHQTLNELRNLRTSWDMKDLVSADCWDNMIGMVEFSLN